MGSDKIRLVILVMCIQYTHSIGILECSNIAKGAPSTQNPYYEVRKVLVNQNVNDLSNSLLAQVPLHFFKLWLEAFIHIIISYLLQDFTNL